MLLTVSSFNKRAFSHLDPCLALFPAGGQEPTHCRPCWGDLPLSRSLPRGSPTGQLPHMFSNVFRHSALPHNWLFFSNLYPHSQRVNWVPHPGNRSHQKRAPLTSCSLVPAPPPFIPGALCLWLLPLCRFSLYFLKRPKSSRGVRGEKKKHPLSPGFPVAVAPSFLKRHEINTLKYRTVESNKKRIHTPIKNRAKEGERNNSTRATANKWL